MATGYGCQFLKNKSIKTIKKTSPGKVLDLNNFYVFQILALLYSDFSSAIGNKKMIIANSKTGAMFFFFHLAINSQFFSFVLEG